MDPQLRLLVGVFAGGSLGTLARAGLTELVRHDPGAWPWATLVANVVAAGALGYVAVVLRDAGRFPLLGPGLCGGLSTFSTLQLELLDMLNAGHVALAGAYVAASVALGLVAVRGGAGMGRRRSP